MANKQVVDYIRIEREKGISDDVIKSSLLNAGWKVTDIADAFEPVSGETPVSAAPSSNEPPVENTSNEGIVTEIPGGMDLIRESFEIFKQHWLQFIGFLFLPSLVVGTLLVIFIIIVVLSGVELTSVVNPETLQRTVIIVGLLMIPSSLLIGFIGMWSTASIMVRVRDRNEQVTFVEIMKRSVKYVWPLLIVAFYTGFIVHGGMLLFIVPGIIFAIWFMFASMIVVFDDVKGMDALLKSKAYVSNIFGKIFSRWIVVILFAMGITISLAIISGSITTVLGKDNPAIILLYLIETPFNLAVSIVGTIFGVLLFSYVKKAKGSFEFVAKTSTKIWLWLVALFGLVAFIAISIGIMGMVISSGGALFNMTEGADSLIPSNSSHSIIDSTFSIDDTYYSDVFEVQFGIEMYKFFEDSYPETLSQIVPEYVSTDPSETFTYELTADGTDYSLCLIGGDCYTHADY
ncbi:hypothetical protein CO180_00120 [candidate division WWE3 bacterium CG_4_9_14_3_um_filter_41_6]|uniref:Uncharacterized protein n=1 Tax=candidate division WWE3 bacterium CG_4_10_14_0_2_um_filter_41_14 TaxID=1975072 RepID=A0A2M7TM38_UNCKA|nr:MAG: hypothetical protein COY32_00210 [candidate division WWE3 bacterium CG_4_10_14_0_2_um_filter_41_14]PJA39718.1 MAG: hypothetical protein CO180_00120 [candidate division WWE3 bacterium CG_4_9_14_3_um_filter_41_6]